MSAKANKPLLGLFVLGALALALGAIVALGSGSFFTKKFRCIMFFPNSVSGLEVGAPVLFRGVPLGTVKSIRILADPEHLKFYIPVVVEILGGRVELSGPGPKRTAETLLQARDTSPADLLRLLIRKGLRAQLVTQSFVTGQLAIALDLLPDTPKRLVGKSDLVEIPTVPSTFEKLAKTLEKLPLQELVDRLIGAVTGIEALVNSPQVKRMPAKIDTALTSATTMLEAVKSQVNPLAHTLEITLDAYSGLAQNIDRRADGLASAAITAMGSFDATLKDARGALGNFQKIVNAKSPTVTDLNRALSEIARAARSIRELADFLERHPEALIQGKGSPRK
ncbi:MlaD family protein [Desulfovibrio sp. JY]|nr:MlaD family protein [Desulfovibrio sp. JY]